jgi:hypothetical protein
VYAAISPVQPAIVGNKSLDTPKNAVLNNSQQKGGLEDRHAH